METDFEHDLTQVIHARPWRAELAGAVVVLVAVVLVALLAGDAGQAEGRGTPPAGNGHNGAAISLVERGGTGQRVPPAGGANRPALA